MCQISRLEIVVPALERQRQEDTWGLLLIPAQERLYLERKKWVTPRRRIAEVVLRTLHPHM